jgi:hypothetical protein
MLLIAKERSIKRLRAESFDKRFDKRFKFNMKAFFTIFASIALIVLAGSCVSAPTKPPIESPADGAPQGNIGQGTEALSPTPEPTADNPTAAADEGEEGATRGNLDHVLALYASMRTKAGTAIKSVDSGLRILEYDPLPESFANPVVFETEGTYYYKGETLISKYQLAYIGVIPEEGLAEAEPGDQIGRSSGEEVRLIARSKEIDPYLVACSNDKPARYDGYWYYFPGMYVPTVMKWLSFKPASYNSFKAMRDHAMEEENRYGYTYFNWWSLLETRLDAYPELIKDDKEERSEQLISFGDIPLKLSYQPGFLGYLLDEYKLGERIYLYLQITGVSGFSGGIFDCYVRDFSLKPPELIIDERLAELRGE